MARKAANIRKRADGTFEKRFSVNGKRFSVYGKTQKEVNAKELEIRTQIANGTYVCNNTVTLDAYFEEWLQNRNVKQSTKDVTRIKYTTHIKPVLGRRRVQDIERREIVDLQQKLVKTHKPASVNGIIGTLKAVLNTAVMDEIIVKNPAANIPVIPKDEDQRAVDSIHRALTMEEQRAFLEEAKTDWLYEFFCFSLYTGMRIMEISALKWGDIDKVNNMIHITKTLAYDYSKHVYYEQKPKSKAGKRDIPINDLIKSTLANQKEKMFMLYGAKGVSADRNIFLGVKGGILASGAVIDVIEKILKRLETKGVYIDYFTPHAFRDTFATRYIEAGGNMQTLKVLLGHSSLAMTMDLYAHVMPDTKHSEMNMVQNAFI